MSNSNDKILVFKDAVIRFQNFSGRAKINNPEGQRRFSIVVDDETAAMLADMGITVSEYVAPDESVVKTVKVKITYGSPYYPDPKVYTTTSGGSVLHDERTIGTLDNEEFEKLDIQVRVGTWKYNGKTGKTLYLQSLYATLVEDVLANEYRDVIANAQRRIEGPDGGTSV